MKGKCDKCDRPATHHSVEVHGKHKVEKNLCEVHAAEEGLSQTAHAPINELLTNFVKVQAAGGDPAAMAAVAAGKDTVCDQCGLTFKKFRESSLLGCPECYKAFDSALEPLLERAHDGGAHHVGKVPHRAGAGEQRQVQLMRMRKTLDDAVAAEDYEQAARLRDDIAKLEEGSGRS
jgi:protein arginine kinase activator